MAILTCGIRELSRDKFNKINFDVCLNKNKPFGGLSGSTFIDIDRYNYASTWLKYNIKGIDKNLLCDCNIFHLLCGVKYNLKKDSKILTINSLVDFINLHKRFGILYQNFAGFFTLTSYNLSYIDWVKLSKEYDAIHFTSKCIKSCGFITHRSNDSKIVTELKGFEYYMYGADYWFVFNFDSIDLESCKTLSMNELFNNSKLKEEIEEVCNRYYIKR